MVVLMAKCSACSVLKLVCSSPPTSGDHLAAKRYSAVHFGSCCSLWLLSFDELITRFVGCALFLQTVCICCFDREQQECPWLWCGLPKHRHSMMYFLLAAMPLIQTRRWLFDSSCLAKVRYWLKAGIHCSVAGSGICYGDEWGRSSVVVTSSRPCAAAAMDYCLNFCTAT